jgi:hypothetical protein
MRKKYIIAITMPFSLALLAMDPPKNISGQSYEDAPFYGYAQPQGHAPMMQGARGAGSPPPNRAQRGMRGTVPPGRGRAFQQYGAHMPMNPMPAVASRGPMPNQRGRGQAQFVQPIANPIPGAAFRGYAQNQRGVAPLRGRGQAHYAQPCANQVSGRGFHAYQYNQQGRGGALAPQANWAGQQSLDFQGYYAQEQIFHEQENNPGVEYFYPAQGSRAYLQNQPGRGRILTPRAQWPAQHYPDSQQQIYYEQEYNPSISHFESNGEYFDPQGLREQPQNIPGYQRALSPRNDFATQEYADFQETHIEDQIFEYNDEENKHENNTQIPQILSHVEYIDQRQEQDTYLQNPSPEEIIAPKNDLEKNTHEDTSGAPVLSPDITSTPEAENDRWARFFDDLKKRGGALAIPRAIQLSSEEAITAASLLKETGKIKELHIAYADIDLMFRPFNQYINQYPNLTELQLTGFEISVEQTRLLTNSLKENKSIKNLHFGLKNADGYHIAMFAKVLQSKNQLLTVKITSQFDEMSLMILALAVVKKHLVTFEIFDADLNTERAETIFCKVLGEKLEHMMCKINKKKIAYNPKKNKFK